MCGIVGYIGSQPAAPIIFDGLKRLEYRGYDSAGLAVVDGSELQIRRSVGKIDRLGARLAEEPVAGRIGLGHTRWATHGRPSEANAHPHRDCSGSLVVVHNGIIENHLALKEDLVAAGHRFRSDTDTEVIAHLIEAHLGDGADLLSAVRATLAHLHGAYALAVLSARAPEELVAAKTGAGSVVIGAGPDYRLIASDIPAVLPHTRDVVILRDGECARITRRGHDLYTLAGERVDRAPSRITWDAAMAEKGGYPHFMLKEIHEQPRAVVDTFRGRLDAEAGRVVVPEAALDPALIARLRRVVLVACGTSYHAGLIGRFMVERLAGLPAEVDLASEFRYRDAVLGPDTLVVAITQSGETADTLGAAKAAAAKGAPVLAITNMVGSAITREANGVLYTHAGPEIGVASSKTFTATLTACYLLGLALGRERGFLTQVDGRKRIDELEQSPALMEAALAAESEVAAAARELLGPRSFLYLGRGVHHPVALEGALKLKELSYVHAEGYAAGEMKHGPIALIDETLPVIALALRDGSYDRMLGNLQEVRARGGRLVAIAHPDDAAIGGLAERVLTVPPAPDLLAPLVAVIPLQLLAYHVAALRGLDVDQPRNLAKSVTVE
jgi:glutamine---fructose-6-phosphate transaminase (isomerizing)